MKIPPCTYFDPCSAKHVKAPMLFQKLDSGKKCLVILATVFTAIGTFFMGGLGGAAVFRHLVYKWSKGKDTSDSSTSKTSQLGENRLSPKNASIQRKDEEVSTENIEKAQTALRGYFLKETERKFNVEVYKNLYRQFDRLGSSLDDNDLIADFCIRALTNKRYYHLSLTHIEFSSKLSNELGETCIMKMDDYKNNKDVLYIHIATKPENRIGLFESYGSFERELLKAEKFFKCLLGINVADITMNPEQMKKVVNSLDNEMKSLLNHFKNADLDNTGVKNDIQEIKRIRNLVFWLTYPLKLFIHLYEVYSNPTLTQTIHDDTIVLPKDIARIIADYADTTNITDFRDLLVKKWTEENSRSLVYQV